MKDVVIGAGKIGATVAGLLASTGYRVTRPTARKRPSIASSDTSTSGV